MPRPGELITLKRMIFGIFFGNLAEDGFAEMFFGKSNSDTTGNVVKIEGIGKQET